jgi:hypothetical protein
VIAVCFTAPGRATSTPALPSSDTPAAVHDFLTGENGRADLEKDQLVRLGGSRVRRGRPPTRAGRLAPDGAGN